MRTGLDATAGRRDRRVLVSAERGVACSIVRVLDNGTGIDAEARGSLFEPLASSKARGMGLGLSVSRALARAMAGDLVIAEVSGWSTCLELRLPI